MTKFSFFFLKVKKFYNKIFQNDNIFNNYKFPITLVTFLQLEIIILILIIFLKQIIIILKLQF